MHTADEPEVRAQPVERHRHADRVVARPRRQRIALGAMTAATALVLGACSSDDDDAEATTTTASEAAAGTDEFVLDEELDPGTYRSENFLIPMSVTVPAGWEIFEDEPGHFGLDVVAHPEPPVLVIRDVAASALGCVEAPAEGVGTTASAIADALANREGIVASDPLPEPKSPHDPGVSASRSAP